MIEMTEKFNQKHDEITTNKATTEIERIPYQARSTAQYDTNMYILSICSFLFMSKESIHSDGLIYLVNTYLLNAWCGPNTVLGTEDIL